MDEQAERKAIARTLDFLLAVVAVEVHAAERAEAETERRKRARPSDDLDALRSWRKAS